MHRKPRAFLFLAVLLGFASALFAYDADDTAGRDPKAAYIEKLSAIKARHAQAHFDHGVKLFEKRRAQ